MASCRVGATGESYHDRHDEKTSTSPARGIITPIRYEILLDAE
jgi:hypothetical protein